MSSVSQLELMPFHSRRRSFRIPSLRHCQTTVPHRAPCCWREIGRPGSTITQFRVQFRPPKIIHRLRRFDVQQGQDVAQSIQVILRSWVKLLTVAHWMKCRRVSILGCASSHVSRLVMGAVFEIKAACRCEVAKLTMGNAILVVLNEMLGMPTLPCTMFCVCKFSLPLWML